MQTFAKATATYTATLLLFLGAVTIWNSYNSPGDPVVSISWAIIFLTVLVGLWAAIPTVVIGAILWAMFHIVAMPVRWRAVAVSTLTAFTSMKVSTYYYAEVFEEIGARGETSVVEVIFLAMLAGLVALVIWTAFPQEDASYAE